MGWDERVWLLKGYNTTPGEGCVGRMVTDWRRGMAASSSATSRVGGEQDADSSDAKAGTETVTERESKTQRYAGLEAWTK